MATNEYGRFVAPETGEWFWGEVRRGEGIAVRLRDCPLDCPPRETRHRYPLSDLLALPIVDPPVILGACLNYLEHAAESGLEMPEEPVLFVAPTSAAVGDGAPIHYPHSDDLYWGITEPYLDPEPELVAIIGRSGELAGYAAGNDVSERWGNKHVIDHGLPWTLPGSLESDHAHAIFKGLPGFKPIGGMYVGDIDPLDVEIWCRVNGQEVQRFHSRDMHFPPSVLAAAGARHLGLPRLPAGTFIYTGVASGIGFNLQDPGASRDPLRPGDVVAAETSFGSVTNPVMARG